MEISEFEKKRAANLIWNSAHDYTIETGFRIYDFNGKADVYWNSIVGAVHLHYDWGRLLAFYNTFHEKINQGVYESLFWLALENAVYERESKVRPVFPSLRRAYAKQKLSAMEGAFSLEDSAGQRLVAITKGHFRRALGEPCGLPDLVDQKLLDEIELGAELDTEEIIAHLARTLEKYFTYRAEGDALSEQERKFFSPWQLFSLFRKKGQDRGACGPVRRMSFGYGEHVAEYGSEVLDQSRLQVAFASYTAQTDEGLKEYITNYFGKPLYDEKEIAALQKEYCQGNHKDVKLHITRGEYTEEMLKAGFAGKMRREAIQQGEKNRKAYEEQEDLCRVQREKLAARIRNSVLVHLEDQTIKAATGRLQGERVWRALYLNDDKVFTKTIRGDMGNLTVDILLDASTSQLRRQETVAAQGYILAQALTDCGIPVRVSSFCSMNGYTVMNVYRDYTETENNRRIFDYFTAGANRDGLAIRLTAGLLQRDNHAEHRILILLSDCQPNDVIKIRSSSGSYQDYAATVAVEDTAAEVHRARMAGISVLCVFMGGEDALPAVHRIYGQDFTRIRQLDLFAEAVGGMLQNRIMITGN